MFFSKKTIFLLTRNKLHKQDFTTINEVFKTWSSYLNRYEFKILVFTNNNNHYWGLMDSTTCSILVLNRLLSEKC